MPKTIYGEVDERVLAQQEQELQESFPRLDFGKGVDEEGVRQSQMGNAYFKNGSFFVAGDQEKIPLTNPGGGSMMGQQRQGYKIHVSAHPEHAAAVARAVLPLFREDGEFRGTYHKYQDLKSYAYEKTGHPGKDAEAELQAGKFITIYPKNEEELKQIAAAVQNALLEHHITPEMGGGIAPGDARIGDTNLMSMRFGQFSGRKENQIWSGGQFIPDDRTKSCPDTLTGEFATVLQNTENHMRLNKVNLSVPRVGTSQVGVGQTSPSSSTVQQTPPPLPPRPQRPELLHTETSQPGMSQPPTGRPLPVPPHKPSGHEPFTMPTVRGEVRPPRQPLPLRMEFQQGHTQPHSTSTSQTVRSLPPLPVPHATETSTSSGHSEPMTSSSRPPQRLPPPVPDRSRIDSNQHSTPTTSPSHQTVGESLGLGGRLERNKRHAMYEDPTKLKELLQQEKEKAETQSHSVGSSLGPRQPPPTGGSGGTGLRVGK